MAVHDHWTLADLPDQTDRRWLITGATNGLGRATALAAAAAGATLVLPVRNRALGEQLLAALPAQRGAPHELVDLDLASLASVRAAAGAVTGEIDVLINNAGMMCGEPTRTADGFEATLGVNFLGPFAFTNLVLPRVCERVVIVASDMHRRARLDLADPDYRGRRWTGMQAYSDSKLADMAWGLALERRLRPRGIGVQLAHPGWVVTNLQSVVGPARLAPAVARASRALTQSVEQSALCLLYAASMDLPPCSYVGPDAPGHLRGWPTLLGRSRAAADPRLAEEVWQYGVRSTGTDLMPTGPR